MTNNNEISATEKLLDLIRADGASAAVDSPPLTPEASSHSAMAHKDQAMSGLDMESGHRERTADFSDFSLTSLPTGDDVDPQEQLPSLPKNFPPLGEGIDTTKYRTQVKEESDCSRWLWYEPTQKGLPFQSCLATLFSLTTIGIDIQPGSVHLVKTQTAKNKRALINCESVTFDAFSDTHSTTDLFNDQALKATLSQKLASFCRCGLRKPEIWCSYAFCNPVAIYNITIPKVSLQDIPQTVFWTLKKEVDFDEKDTILDYSIFKEVEIKGQLKLQTIVTLIPKRETDAIRALFNELGHPLTGLTFPAAAIQNFLRLTHPDPDTGPIVYFTIRDQNSFIDLFYQGKMLFSREIKTGVTSFVESVINQAATHDILLDDDSAKSYIFNLLKGKSIQKNSEMDLMITKALDLGALPVIERLIRQLLRTFEYCTTNFKIPAVERLYTSGASVLNAELLEVIQARLRIPCSVINPFAEGIFNLDHPLQIHPELNILPAAGLSLSDRQTTTNFLFTYLERTLEKISLRNNQMIACGTIACALIIGVVFAFQYERIKANRKVAATLDNSLNQKYSEDPRTRSTEYIVPAIAKIKASQVQYQASIDRFKALGVIQEITHGLPEEAKLTNINFVFPSPKKKTNNLATSKKKTQTGSIVLNGIISAPYAQQDFILLSMMKRLNTLKFTSNPDLEPSAQKPNDTTSSERAFTIRLSFREDLQKES